jgi:hypothetical protein
MLESEKVTPVNPTKPRGFSDAEVEPPTLEPDAAFAVPLSMIPLAAVWAFGRFTGFACSVMDPNPVGSDRNSGL